MILTSELADAWPHGNRNVRDAVASAWWALEYPDTEPSLPPDIFGPHRDDLWRVEELLENISQGVWAASWLSQIDVQVWGLLNDRAEGRSSTRETHPYCTDSELAQWLTELRTLTIDQGWFPVYDFPGRDDYRVGRMGPLPQASAWAAKVAGDVVAGEVIDDHPTGQPSS